MNAEDSFSILVNCNERPWIKQVAAYIHLKALSIEALAVSARLRAEISECLAKLEELPAEWSRELCWEILETR